MKNAKTPHSHLLRVYALAIAALCLVGLVTLLTGDWLTPLTTIGLGMGFMKFDNDPAVYKTKALPAGATTTVSDGIDLMNTDRGDFLANLELLIQTPALATGELPDAATIIFDVYHDTDPEFGSEELLMDNVLTVTGAGGAGAAAAEKRVRFPVDVHRYIRVKATGVAATDADALEFTARLVF